MRLTCLGGAAAWPNPGQGCSSFLVETTGTSVLLDAGPNTLLELRKHVQYSTLDAIVISHCHADHILDLVPYRYGLFYGPEKTKQPIPLWLPPGGIERLERLASALGTESEPAGGFWTTVFSPREYQPDETISVGNISIAFRETDHAVTCYAMRLTGPTQSSLTYTADTGSINALVAFAQATDLLIAEATLPEADDSDAGAGHLKPSQAGALASSASAIRLVITHLWAERPDVDVIEAAQHEFDGDILIAKPGLVIDV